MNAALKFAILSTVRTQIALSALTGIREDKISRIVQGWYQPTAAERRRIARALGRPEGSLFEVASEGMENQPVTVETTPAA